MTGTDRPHFAALMARLGDAFGVALKPARVAVYYDALADRPVAYAERAVRRAIESCAKFPTVSELRKFGRQDMAAIAPITTLALDADKLLRLSVFFDFTGRGRCGSVLDA